MVVLLIVIRYVLLPSNLVHTFQSPCSEYVTGFAGINEFLYVHGCWHGIGGLTFSFFMYYRHVFVTYAKFQPYFDMLKGAQRSLAV